MQILDECNFWIGHLDIIFRSLVKNISAHLQTSRLGTQVNTMQLKKRSCYIAGYLKAF